MIILSWMGTPDYAVKAAAPVEVVQEIMPEEGAGLVREIGYAHIPVGVWRTDEMYPEEAQDHEFAHLMEEFRAGVDYYERTDPDFNDAYAELIVTQDQPQLKRLHWRVHWFDAEGLDGIFERSFWLHEDSLYWEEYGWKSEFMNYLSDLRFIN
jgi:ubiquinol-cytochrome c reductase cytochrome b subunit